MALNIINLSINSCVIVSTMQNCTTDCIHMMGNFSHGPTCSFVQQNCQQTAVQFIEGYYCWGYESFALMVIVALASILLIYVALQMLSDDYLAPCIEQFISKWGISDALAGISFVAFAVGAPDVITAIVAGSSDSTTTALIPVGSLYGAALFGMGFILSKVISFSEDCCIKLQKREVLIPLGFYIFGTVYLICISVFYSKMNLFIALPFLALYPIYLGVIAWDEKQKMNNRELSLIESESQQEGAQQKQEENEGKQSVQLHGEQPHKQESDLKRVVSLTNKGMNRLWTFIFTYTVPPYDPPTWKPLRVIISTILAPLVCAATYGFTDSLHDKMFDIPYLVWFSVLPVFFLIHSIICTVRRTPPQQTILYSLFSFIIIVCWITLVCSILINLMELLQILTNMNAVFLGLTVLAWANSVGDYFSITAFAKKNYASTAIAGVFSGQLFNFLLGFGISCVINSINGEYEFVMFDFAEGTLDVLSDSIVLAVIGFSVIYMVWMGYRILRQNGTLSRYESKVAKWYYVIYIFLALALSISTDFFQMHSCSAAQN